MSRINLASAFLFGFSLLVQPLMAQIPISNASFELGDDSPDNWTLTGGDGGWYTPAAAGDRAICVLGDGTSSNAWLSSPASLAANTVYRLRFQACRPAGNTGLAMTGPVFCNRDLSSVSETWNAYESFFVTPRDVQADQTRLRFGQWEVPGKVAFDDLHLNRVVPIYRRVEGLVLGTASRFLAAITRSMRRSAVNPQIMLVRWLGTTVHSILIAGFSGTTIRKSFIVSKWDAASAAGWCGFKSAGIAMVS
jgi:hypothetical protein